MTSTRLRTFFRRLAAPLAALLIALTTVPAMAQEHAGRFTFFQGTQYPLTVHFLRGTQPGPTVMVQGGIQGDELSGFLTAQLLSHASVTKGNLIVIPRANVPSVLARKRQINVDLNRRFDKDYNDFYEDRLARAIRFLLAGSDAFIHLHEGSGFYHPTYVDGLRNPGRYGQSIIIDTPMFAGRINLAQVATSVLTQLNHSIVPAWQFKLFNTNTFATNTMHPEQRKSLTYHALSVAGIPALAIEVSKHIRSLGWKVSQHLRATVLTLEQYGVEVAVPEFSEEDIERYAATCAPIRINGQPVRPGARNTLSLAPGERIRVAAAEHNSALAVVPGVFASDRPEQNLVGSSRMALTPFSRLNVLADGARVAHVDVAWKDAPASGGGAGTPPLFACWLNGEPRFIPEGETLQALEGDQLVLEGVWGSTTRDEVLNLKGYVSQPGRNDGQDAGQEIVLDPGTFIARYLDDDDDGVLCRIVRETPGKRRAKFYLRIRPRAVHALRLSGPQGPVVVPWTADGAYALPPGEYRFDSAWSNGDRDKLLATTGGGVTPWDGTVTIAPGAELPVTLRQATTFKPIGSMTLTAAPERP